MISLAFFLVLLSTLYPKIIPKADISTTEEKVTSEIPTAKLLDKPLYLGNEFSLVSSLPLTGGVSLAGTDIDLGLSLVFNRANRQGGIKNKFTIKLFVVDDHYKAELTRKNVLNSCSKTDLALATFGPDALNSLREEILANRLAAIFPLGGEGLFQSAKSKHCENIIFYRAPQSKEIAMLLSYATRKMLRHKIAIFYEDSHFGEQGVRSAEKVLGKWGLKIVAKASYPKNTLGVMNAVKQISAQTPDAVLCIAHSYPAYNFIQQIVNEGFSACLFLGLGELAPIQQIIARSRGIKLILSSSVPSPTSEIDIAKQYREAMKKDMPIKEITSFGFEGYICAKILSEALEELSEDATLGELFVYLKKLDKDWCGIKLKYNPKTKTLSDTVWLNDGQSGTAWLSDKQIFELGLEKAERNTQQESIKPESIKSKETS